MEGYLPGIVIGLLMPCALNSKMSEAVSNTEKGQETERD